MGRYLLLICGLLFFLALGGCELFSTASVAAKPGELNHLQKLFEEQDVIEYRLEEVLDPGNGDDTLVSRKRFVFTYVKDTLVDGKEMAYFQVQVNHWETGEEQMRNHFLVRSEAGSLEYRPQDGEKSPKVFLLKTAGRAGEADGFFKTLPVLAFNGSPWVEKRGGFTFSRYIDGVDTLEYHNSLEESWVVREEVTHGSQKLMEGSYLYGRSGLLSSTQTWKSLDRRGTAGGQLGPAAITRTFLLL